MMPLRLTENDWKSIFPNAPQAVIDAFTNDVAPLDAAGITQTRTRLAYALANVEHECGGFTIKGLAENINYTAARMADVWSSRFESAAAVRKRYGTGAGWQKKAFDEIYGTRMGNRPGTSDGSTYIGRGGPQITGRDGYREVGKRCGLDLVGNPNLASDTRHQPAILGAFWTWKKLNTFADNGNFEGCVKAWNGGTNGLKDRLSKLAGNDPIVQRLSNVATLIASLDNAKREAA